MNQEIEKMEQAVMHSYDSEKEEYDRVNYQGFAGQQYEKKLSEKQKGIVMFIKVVIWLVAVTVVLKIIL